MVDGRVAHSWILEECGMSYHNSRQARPQVRFLLYVPIGVADI